MGGYRWKIGPHDFVPKVFANSHRPKVPKTLVRIDERSIMA